VVSTSRHSEVFWTKWNRSNLRLVFGLQKADLGSRSYIQEVASSCPLSLTNLAAIHATAKKDCLRLFHLLFDEFFTAEECKNAVTFGKHGKVPDGKRVLDRFKVNAILSKYVLMWLLKG